MDIDQETLNNFFTGKVINTAQDVGEFWADSANSVITENDEEIFLHQIVVREQEKGIGSSFMIDLCNYADRVSKPIILEPDDRLGGSLDRLIDFYSRFDFVQEGSRMRREPK